MKDILFRGKRTDTGEWVEGSYLKMDECAYIMPPVKYTGITIVEMFVRVNPETVGQYTGLKDDSGAKIFEGDILSLNQYGLVIVIYQDGCFGAIEGGAFSPLMPSLWGMGGKIVGNVHDNPNLIAEGK